MASTVLYTQVRTMAVNFFAHRSGTELMKAATGFPKYASPLKIQYAGINHTTFDENTRRLRDSMLETRQSESEIKDNLLATRSDFDKKPKFDRLYENVEIMVRGNDPAVLNSYFKFLQLAIKECGFKSIKSPRPHYIRWHQWVLRDVFAHKKVKLHYETRTHTRKIGIKHVTGSTASAFLEYIERNIPEGVGMKVTYTEIKPMPQIFYDIRQSKEEPAQVYNNT